MAEDGLTGVGGCTIGVMFDGQHLAEALQQAVSSGDREHLDALVSERMIWTMPSPDNERGKRAWIEASCSIVWHWFEVTVRRTIDLGDVQVLELWIKQSRDPVASEDHTRPVVAAGVVLDVWAKEGDAWRLVARHPQREGG